MGKPLSNYIVCNIFMFLVVSLAACQPTVEPAFLPAPTPTTNETNHTIIPTVDRSVESTAESPPLSNSNNADNDNGYSCTR